MRRTHQLAQELRDVVGRLLTTGVEFPPAVVVTVTRAAVSRDARAATVYLSVLPPARGREILDLLTPHLYELQGRINETFGRPRGGPRVTFALDPWATALDSPARFRKDQEPPPPSC